MQKIWQEAEALQTELVERRKLKLADDEDIARVSAVREGAPQARLIVDANEGWDETIYLRQAPELARLGRRKTKNEYQVSE